MLKIGNVQLDNASILAPMAGVTDLPFRVICAEMGVGLVCTEMISAKAITYKNKATNAMMEISPKEGMVSLQLFGSEPDVMAEAVKMIDDLPYQILDINMGCPVTKVVSNNEGSALMRNPDLAYDIAKAVVKASSKPVTCKIRAGYTHEEMNAPEFAKRLEDAGVSAICVHGRTKEDMYRGNVNYDIIKKVVDAVSIPVIGNGDITNVVTATKMYEETGCAGIAVARGARGNPWIFKSLISGEDYKPSKEEVINMMIKHLNSLLEIKGEYTAIREMRAHASWYTAGMYGSTEFRRKINMCNTKEELTDLMENM